MSDKDDRRQARFSRDGDTASGTGAAAADHIFPIGGGFFVAVAGPSGAGKDTLLDYARGHFSRIDADVRFVRRVVTREANGADEDHDTLDRRAFERAVDEGAFACAWEANGLNYGLPVGIDAVIAAGRVVVANVSRAAIGTLARRYTHVLPVLVTAREEVLAARLAARGREDGAAIRRRLARNATYAVAPADWTVIDNSGEAEEAGKRLVAVIGKALARSAFPDIR